MNDIETVPAGPDGKCPPGYAKTSVGAYIDPKQASSTGTDSGTSTGRTSAAVSTLTATTSGGDNCNKCAGIVDDIPNNEPGGDLTIQF